MSRAKKADSLESGIVSQEEGQRIWNQEQAVFDVTELICGIMNEQKVTRAELATKLGKSRPYITQLLDGATNMTIRTVADVLGTLGYRLNVTAESLHLPAVVQAPVVVECDEIREWIENARLQEADQSAWQSTNSHLKNNLQLTAS